MCGPVLSRFCHSVLFHRRAECFTLIVFPIPRDSVLRLFFVMQWVGLQCVIVVFFDFSLTVKAAPHECVIRTSQP